MRARAGSRNQGRTNMRVDGEVSLSKFISPATTPCLKVRWISTSTVARSNQPGICNCSSTKAVMWKATSKHTEYWPGRPGCTTSIVSCSSTFESTSLTYALADLLELAAFRCHRRLINSSYYLITSLCSAIFTSVL